MVGNSSNDKIGLKERVIKAEQGQQFGRANNAQYFEVNAKTGHGFKPLFATEPSSARPSCPRPIHRYRQRGDMPQQPTGPNQQQT
jgi:hypothetical protein